MDTPPNDYVIQGQQFIAGLIGSLIMVLRDQKQRKRSEQVASVLSGVASSVYLTEPVIQFFYRQPIEPKYLLGFSFMFGVLGLRLIELFADAMEKFITKRLNDADITND